MWMSIIIKFKCLIWILIKVNVDVDINYYIKKFVVHFDLIWIIWEVLM